MARPTRDIIHRALRIIGVLGAGETANADDANDALIALNQMLDLWSADSLMAYVIDEQSLALTGGVATYTVGATGALNTTRPLAIQYGFTRDASATDRPVSIITQEQYANIVLKSLPASYPEALYYDATYPLGVITLYPAPMSGLTLFVGLWQPLTAIPTLDTILDYPPGYEAAITYSLAEGLAPEYQRPVTPDLARVAAKARANIQGVNLPQVFLNVEFGSGDRSLTYTDFVRGFV